MHVNLPQPLTIRATSLLRKLRIVSHEGASGARYLALACRTQETLADSLREGRAPPLPPRPSQWGRVTTGNLGVFVLSLSHKLQYVVGRVPAVVGQLL